MSIPPASSHFQAMPGKIKSNSHGNALGLFLIIPLIPPPYSLEPDKSAKIKTTVPIVNNEYRALNLKKLAILIDTCFSTNGYINEFALTTNYSS